MLPCYWIYARVGEHLQRHGSPEPLFQRWIDTYAGEEFQSVVDEVLAVTDRIGAQTSPAEWDRMRRHFPPPRVTSGCSSTPPTGWRTGRCDQGRVT